MNVGLLVGLGEIELLVLQLGSLIMLGKVNLVILEVIVMVCVQVIGYYMVIIVVGQIGNFQFNVILLLIVVNLFDGIGLLVNVLWLLVDSVIVGLKVCEDCVVEVLVCNLILVMVLNLIIGYEKVVVIVKCVYKEQCLVLDVVLEDSGLEEVELWCLLDLIVLIVGGIYVGGGGGGG